MDCLRELSGSIQDELRGDNLVRRGSSWWMGSSFSIRAPISEWVFMISNSSVVSRPGLLRILSSMAILPH